MNEVKPTAYVELCGAKGDPTGIQRFYRIWISDQPSGQWRGPYRDKSDAENAAEDEARIHNYELIWRN